MTYIALYSLPVNLNSARYKLRNWSTCTCSIGLHVNVPVHVWLRKLSSICLKDWPHEPINDQKLSYPVSVDRKRASPYCLDRFVRFSGDIARAVVYRERSFRHIYQCGKILDSDSMISIRLNGRCCFYLARSCVRTVFK